MRIPYFLFIIILHILIVFCQADLTLKSNELKSFVIQSNSSIITKISLTSSGDAIALLSSLNEQSQGFGNVHILADNSTNTSDRNTTYSWNQSNKCILTEENQKCLFLESISNFNITCISQEPCSFSLSIYILNAIISYPENKQITPLNFTNIPLKLVKFLKIEKDKIFNRFVIETRLMNSQGNHPNLTAIQFFPNKGKSQLKGDQILTMFTQQEISDTTYALISGNNASNIEIHPRLFQSQEEIALNETVSDYFMKSEFSPFISYQINFQELQKTQQDYDYIQVYFKWYELKQGKVNLVVSCDALQKDFSLAYWFFVFKPSLEAEKIDQDSLINKQYSLIISNQTFQKGCQSSQLNIGITSNDDFGFFKASIQAYKETYPLISINEIVSGKTEGDIINIYLQVPYSEEETVTIDMRNNFGNSNLYLRECLDKYCLPEKFTYQNLLEMNSRSSRLETNQRTRTIQFLPSCSKKFSQNQQCDYIIGIVPTDPQQLSLAGTLRPTFAVQYQIEVFSEFHEIRQLLKENQIFEGRVLSDDNSYFALYLQNTNDIEHIIVRASSSYIQLYVSVDHKCQFPNPTCKNPKYLKRGLNMDPIMLTGVETQTGAVFVGIYGFTATLFTVVVEVQRVNQTLITKLKSGTLYHGQLNPEQSIQFFTFDPNTAIESLSENDKIEQYDTENIEIHLRGQKDKLVILVNNDGSIPYHNENGFIWQSSSGVLFISKNNPKYKKGASYNIAIMVTEHAFDLLPGLVHPIDSSTSLQFELVVTVGSVPKVIEISKPIQDKILPRGSVMYSLLIEQNHEENIIVSIHQSNHKNDKNSHINVLVGSQPFENLNQYEISYPFNQSFKQIEQQQLVEICQNNYNAYGSCILFIGLNSTLDSEVHFTLTVLNRRFAIELKEGLQHSECLYSIDEYINMYFQPTNQEHSLNVFISSKFGHTGFNAVLWANRNKSSPMLWPYPSSSNQSDINSYHYISGIHNQHSITFEAIAFRDCWPDCFLLLSISSYQGLPDGNNHNIETIVSDFNEDQIDRLNDRFTVLISSIYADLYFNQQLEFTINEHDSKFFYISLEQIFKTKDSVLLEITSLSGRAVIFYSSFQIFLKLIFNFQAMSVTMKDDIINRYPSFSQGNQSDYTSYSNYLKITNNQLQNLATKYQIQIEQNPQLVIEVFCISESAGRFVISAMEGNSPVLDLMHGLPQETYLLPNQIRYYKYFHFVESDFVVKFSKQTGSCDIRVRVCKDTHNSNFKDYQECMLRQEDFIDKHSEGEVSSSIHVNMKDSKFYCQNCLYVISLKGEEQETHAFLTILLQQDYTWLQEGRQLIDSVDPHSVNLYRLSVDGDEETQISLQFYSGSAELKYSYRYSYDIQQFMGPIVASQIDKFIHLTLRPRQTLIDEDDNFNPFNKPKQIDEPILNSTPSYFDNYAYIQDLSEYFFETEIFLAVFNNSTNISSNYSIVFNGGDSYRYLYDGKIMGCAIPPDQKITYIYHYFEYETPARLNVFSHSKNFQLDQLKLSTFHDLMKNSRDYKDISKVKVELSLISSYDYSVSYALPERNGTYEIQFFNDHPTKTLNLSLSINAKDMVLIPLTQTIQHGLAPSSFNYYEIIVPKQGYITLTTIHCLGEFIFGVTQNLDQFVSSDYQTTSSFPGSTHVETFKVKPGPLYIAFQTNLEEAFYKIRPDFFETQKNIPHDKIRAGNSGIINHKINSNGKREIIFSPVICQECSSTIITKSQIKYDVIYSTDINILNILGKCEASNYYEKDSKSKLHFSQKINPQAVFGGEYKKKSFSLSLEEQKSIEYILNFENDEPKIYFVTIVASVSHIPNQVFQEMNVFYENTKIETNKIHSQFSLYTFIVACLLVIGFFIITTLLFWKRYKKLQSGIDVSQKWRDVEIQKYKDSQQQQEKLHQQQLEQIQQQDLSNASFNLLTSTNDLMHNFKSEEPKKQTAVFKQEITSTTTKLDENPFNKISIHIAPPKQNPIEIPKKNKNGYNNFIDED